MLEKSFVEERKYPKPTLDALIKKKDYKGLSEHLTDGISDYLEGETFKRFLDFMSHFHKYSQRNVRLILEQKPYANQVAGFQSWKKLGRSVTKGSQAIYVYAPRLVDQKDTDGQLVTNEEGEIQTTLHYFLTPVFDVSQTSGEKEIPQPLYNLTGNLDDPKVFTRTFEVLKKMTNAAVKLESFDEPGNGYYDPDAHRIVIREGLGEVMTLKVLIHELTHALLHTESSARYGTAEYGKHEFEAESVAYIVASHLGIDSSDYSFGYLSSWTSQGNKLEELKDSLEVITRQAKEMIEHIDRQLEKVSVLAAPKNKFEERVLEARSGVIPPKRVPTKQVEVSSPPKKLTAEESTAQRLQSGSPITKKKGGATT